MAPTLAESRLCWRCSTAAPGWQWSISTTDSERANWPVSSITSNEPFMPPETNQELRLTPSTLEMLEWPEFLEFYSGFAASPAGRERALRIKPVEDLENVLALSSEALACAQKDQIPALGSLENLNELLQRAAIENQILEGVELYRILRLIALNNEVRG